MTKILMIGFGLNINGGIQRYIQNLLSNMELSKYDFELLGFPPADPKNSTEESLRALGVKIRYMPPDKHDYLKFFWKFFKENRDYDIIHLHTAAKLLAPACMEIKHFCPKAKLIAHAHIVLPPLTWDWHVAHVIYQATVDYFLGCGVEAGRFVFGHNIHKKKNFSVACNAVDKNRFCPNEQSRADIRAKLGVTDEQRVIGFVGRYTHQKNVSGILDIFSELYKIASDCRLVMVGGGEDQEMVDEKIARLGLTEAVIQTGVQHDVPAYMNAFDAFLLPSEFEGSPVTLIEAQGCGTPCYASTNVPQDGKITPIIQYLPLSIGPKAWAEKLNAEVRVKPHDNYWPQMEEAGYELKAAARRMERLYDELVK